MVESRGLLVRTEQGYEGWEMVNSRSCWDDIDIFKGKASIGLKEE